MQENKDKFIKIKAQKDFRLIAVSDIHGGLDILVKLLDKVNLQEDDYLVIIGDSILKAGDSIATLEYLKKLCKRPNTYILAGNCERFTLSLLSNEERAEDLLEYAKLRPHIGLIEYWTAKLGLDIHSIQDHNAFQKLLADNFKEDIAFLSSLPLALEFDDFIFVHAGIDCVEDWTKSKYETLTHCSSFLEKGHILDKYVVVGHWPTGNYRKQSLNNNVIIDHQKKIISIDGGHGVKSFGQINALIINKQKGDYGYSTEALDGLKECRVTKTTNIENQPIVKLDWMDNSIELLEKGEEFSLCRKISTRELVKIKNQLIVQKDEKYICSTDYVSLFLNVNKDDKVKIAGDYGQYILAKSMSAANNNELGWIHKDFVEIEDGE